MKRRSLIGALPALAYGLAARGQDGPAASQVVLPTRRYVALSLVGDRLLQISGVGAAGTGSILRGRAVTTSQPQPNAPHDRLALSALAEALQRTEPTAAVVGLASTAASDFTDQEEWFVGDQLKLPDVLRKAVEAEHAQRLLLVTKERGPARVSDGHFSEGPASGHFEGLGVYFDSNQMMADKTRGFLAPFVYIKVSLVELGTFTVLGSRAIESTHPMRVNWTVAADEIGRLLSAGILETTPKLMAAAHAPA